MANKGDGDIVYVIRADDSNFEKDLSAAQKKAEKSLKKQADDVVNIEKQKTKDLKAESEKVVKNSEKAADGIKDAFEDAGTNAKKAIGNIDISNQNVNIKVDADVSNAKSEINSLEAKDMNVDIKADTSKAESEIQSISKDKSIDISVKADVSGAKSDLESLENVADGVGEKISNSLGAAGGNIGDTLKSGLGGAVSGAIPLVGDIGALTSGLSGAATVAVGTGAVVAGIGVAAVNTANEMDKAMNQFISSTGKSKEETERYQGVLEGIYKNNYGEGFLDISESMGVVTKNLGDMDDSSLQTVTESAFALRDVFEYDISESTRAAKAMMDNFGIDGEKAMGLIGAGAQNGLDYSGELIDSISEYSVQFAKVGFDADDMFTIFQQGAESGAFNLDKVGDAVKEFSIRSIDGSKTTTEGFEAIGLNADDMAAKFSKGGDSAKKAFQDTINALAKMEDPIAQNAAGVALFGTQWEDLGPEAVAAMAEIQDSAYGTGEELSALKDIKYDDLGAMFEGLTRSVELLLLPLGEALIPILSVLIETVLPLITSLLEPLIEIFTALLEPILNLVSSALQPFIEMLTPLIDLLGAILIPVLEALMEVFQSVFDGIVTDLTSSIDRMKEIFGSIIDFIKNVFAGNWEGALQNIKDILGNIVGGFADMFKRPINFIIDMLNGLINGINGFVVPEWVPVIGGASANIPNIPRLKVGMDYVPSDYFPAYLDEGEAVLTKQENAMYRELGGVQGMLSQMSTLNGSQSTNSSANLDIDYQKLAAAMKGSNGDIVLQMNGAELMRWIKDQNDGYRSRTDGTGYFD